MKYHLFICAICVGASRPVTPKPTPSPAKEPPADPLTAEIHSNENTTLEIIASNQPLGVVVVGGNDTHVPVRFLISINCESMNS